MVDEVNESGDPMAMKPIFFLLEVISKFVKPFTGQRRKKPQESDDAYPLF